MRSKSPPANFYSPSASNMDQDIPEALSRTEEESDDNHTIVSSQIPSVVESI